MPISQNTYTVPNNFVQQYDLGQKKIRADLLDENFTDAAGAINTLLTDVAANDAAAVHKTGAETISGNKTFSGNNTFSGTNTFSDDVTFSGNVTLPASAVSGTSVALDGSNTASIGSTLSTYMAHAAMAGRQFEEMSVPASQGYVTAPDDGYLFFQGAGDGGMGALTLDWLNSQGTTVGICGGYILSTAEKSGAFLPVSSGDSIRVYYRAAKNLRLFFVYANGSATA